MTTYLSKVIENKSLRTFIYLNVPLKALLNAKCKNMLTNGGFYDRRDPNASPYLSAVIRVATYPGFTWTVRVSNFVSGFQTA